MRYGPHMRRYACRLEGCPEVFDTPTGRMVHVTLDHTRDEVAGFRRPWTCWRCGTENALTDAECVAGCGGKRPPGPVYAGRASR